MKNLLCAFTLALILFAVGGFAQTGKTVNFQRYEKYFEQNNSGLKGSKSYLVLTDQTGFDKIFHPAATMGENIFLPGDAFQSRMVVATVKRGSLRTYDNVAVTESAGVLTVSYHSEDRPRDSANYRSPLILA